MFVLQFRFWLFAVLVAFGQSPLRAQLFLEDQGASTNSPASSNLVTLGWNPSPDASAIGYFIGWGLASGDCTNQLDAGNETSATVGGLATNVMYYFTVTAYDSAGDESVPSNEIAYSAPTSGPATNAPPAQTNLPPSLGRFVLTTLVSFNGTNGANPAAGLVQGNDGNFYGATPAGGANGFGTSFQMTPSGVLTTLATFTFLNGADPSGQLFQGQDGNLYGTTTFGGFSGAGTIFKMTTNGTLQTLVSFDFMNGSWPSAGLVQGRDGSFYGTTTYGGANGVGTAFPMTTNGAVGAWYSFGGGSAGANPSASLIQSTDGSFYGTTPSGGATGNGEVFRLTTNGVIATSYSFAGRDGGSTPRAPLIQGTDGNLYGTASAGGTNGHGTVFRLTTNGSLTTLFSFNGSNGASPQAGLLQAADGNFYGTTQNGGAYTNLVGSGYGTVFTLTTNGTLTTLVSFNGTNGAGPQAGLVQGTDGNFYGTTASGGSFNNGTVFRLSFIPPPTIRLLVTNVVLSANSNGLALMPDLTGTNYTLISDPCSNSVVLTQSVAANTVLALGTNPVVLTLTDGCGNAAYATNFVIVQDTTPPVLQGLPPTTERFQALQDVPPAPTVTATDNCDGAVAVNYIQAESNPGASCGNVITRTWTATDRSGNTTNFAQTITVNDTTPPVLIQGTILPWYATQAAAEAAALAATSMSDNCTPAAQLTTTVSTTGCSNATITVAAIDGCGNTASVVYNTHIDNTPPLIQTLTQSGGTLTLSWSAMPWQTYQMQYTTDLSQTNWNILGNAITTTNALAMASDSIGPDERRFYRVVVLP